MKNKFNNLSSKEWLPFQKSWVNIDQLSEYYRKSMRFFCKSEENIIPEILYKGSEENGAIFEKICKEEKFKFLNETELNTSKNLQYVFIDITQYNSVFGGDEFEKIYQEINLLINKVKPVIKNKRFISILCKNSIKDNLFFPLAWNMSYKLRNKLHLKDEKIICLDEKEIMTDGYFSTHNNVIYALHFRKDEEKEIQKNNLDFFIPTQTQHLYKKNNNISSWHIIKPKQRNKKEILHPAKYPEELVGLFVKQFTNNNDNVFDPMSGTGSTQLESLKLGRNAYGTELSSIFHELSLKRINEFMNPVQMNMFDREEKKVKYKILNLDSKNISKQDFPEIDYVVTSPPYWDMLNMKGAENQALRKNKGLKLNYSDDKNDLGNIEDYNDFLDKLVEIYLKVIELMKDGSYMTVVVKNIKKEGYNYTFAYDLSYRLSKYLSVLPEIFWLQDDQNLAPYGFGNTFVSNTFHHYCLNFQKIN